MKPYYSEEGITIYLGDCREVLPLVTADVLITDPPYGVGLVRKTSTYHDSPFFNINRKRSSSTLYEDDQDSIRALITETIPLALARVDRGLIFSGPKMLFAYPEPEAIGGVFVGAGAGRSPWGFQCHHPILYYGKDPFLQDGKGGRPNGFRDEQPNREPVDHPCPKPLKWMAWAVERASRPGEIILDPFMGSGTTLKAAKAAGRKAIGIEIEERYCEVAVQRLAQGVLTFGT